jgi:hypothetical protein
MGDYTSVRFPVKHLRDILTSAANWLAAQDGGRQRLHGEVEGLNADCFEYGLNQAACDPERKRLSHSRMGESRAGSGEVALEPVKVEVGLAR